jgi:hypothetical protein
MSSKVPLDLAVCGTNSSRESEGIRRFRRTGYPRSTYVVTGASISSKWGWKMGIRSFGCLLMEEMYHRPVRSRPGKS